MPRAVWVLFALVLSAGAAHAERVRTTRTTKVHQRTGEQSGVVTKVAAGKTLNVIARQGRWLKVRVSGRTGYVPRSKVDMPDDDEIVRNTRRRPFVDGRSTKRGFGGDSPGDRIGADATGDNEVDGGDDEGDGEGDDEGDKNGKRASQGNGRDRDDREDDDEPADDRLGIERQLRDRPPELGEPVAGALVRATLPPTTASRSSELTASSCRTPLRSRSRR